MATSNANLIYFLSRGALTKILDGETVPNAVLQILGYKKIPGNTDRFRLLLNDGVVLFPHAVLTTQLNNFIYNGSLEKYTIFKLKNYAFSQLMHDKKIIICLDIEIIVPGEQVNEKIFQRPCNLNESISNQNPSSSQPLCTASTSTNSFTVKLEPCSSTSDISQNWDTARSQNSTSCNLSCPREAHIFPISNLTPYQTKWTIKARAIYKTYIVSYNTSRGQGKYFSFYLIDNSGTTRVTAFDENAEKLFEIIKLNKIYFVSKATVRSPRGNCPVQCEYELIVEKNTKVEECLNDQSTLPYLSFIFCTIDQIISLPKGSFTDVIGICMDISDITTVRGKDADIIKRSFNLMDKSEKSLIVTLWGSDAKNFPVSKNHVIAIKNAKVTDFRGCSLSVSPQSMVFINPEIKETRELQAWLQNLDSSIKTSLIFGTPNKEASQNWKLLAEINSYSSNNLEMPMYFTTKATIVYVKKNATMYQACCFPGCQKKIIDLNNGLYRCNKCNKDYNTFNWSMLLCLEIADFSGSQFAISFQETAEKLIGKSSDEFNKIKNEDEDRYYELLHNLNLKSYVFKMRSYIGKYDDNKILKTSILSTSSVDAIMYTKKLMTDIRRMSMLLNN